VTQDLGWKNNRPIPVYALFWKGVLMSIYSRKYGYGTRMQTLSNPSTAGRNVAFWGSASRVAYPMCLLGLFAAFLGYCGAEKQIETDENGPTLSTKAHAQRRALLLSDEAALQATGRNAVWLLQGVFAGSQAWMIGLGLTAYNQALHPPKFAMPTPFASPDPLLVGGAVALSVSLLALATFFTFRHIKLNPPFPSFYTVKLGAWNAILWAHIGWAPLVFASIETHNSLFLVAGELAIWAFVQLLLVPHYRALWRAVLEEVRAEKSPLQRATWNEKAPRSI